ncbi:MAG TPA: DUF1844 domain-containing protein [Bryobacteraceae bacterium]|jgi:hypothetical protein|nr:DUF1844 domain-containing protein [Bryobacteraceae bacterium]
MADETAITPDAHEDDDDFGVRPELPTPDFDFLVYSLRLQAELNMGLLPMGGPGEEDEADFELARHNIDLLAMLQEKTRGNLSAEEQRALDNSVTELRLRFVEAQQGASKA